MSEKKALEKIRDKIDSVDVQIQQFLNQRAALAQEVAKIKIEQGEQTDFYRPEREAAILRNLMMRNEGPLSDPELARLFREIMSACLAAEKPLRVAYLGPEGSFTEAATQKQFGGSCLHNPMSTIADVFKTVESGQVSYGVVPVENSTEGMVTHTLDRFLVSPLNITGEVTIRIHHHLLSKHEKIDEIRTVYAHPQTFAQCRQWLIENLPQAKLIRLNSNSEAAKKVANEHNGSAAIAPLHAADIYKLNVLADKVEDELDNTTRFLVIGSQQVAASGSDKTTFVASTKNKSGALHDLLKPLADAGISMTRIESRPSRKGVWEYIFFIDIEGHIKDEKVATALSQIEEASSVFRILGSYPKAVF